MSVHGNISHAMRDNYNEFGVDEYYRKVSATYRNPFYPSVKQTVWAIMNRWWTQEGQALGRPIRILDLAAGSGEVTECLLSWQATGQKTGSAPLPQQSAPSQVNGRAPFIPPKIARQRASAQDDPPSLPAGSFLDIVATDPFTVEAYTTRTSRTCHPLSFSDLASGQMPPETQDSTDGGPTWDLIICSFALHLVPTPSELFALMYELSNKAAWFIVIAPHKKPEIKEAWGWTRWDISNWNPSSDNSASEELGSGSEIIRDKTRLRLYKSLSCESAPVALDAA